MKRKNNSIGFSINLNDFATHQVTIDFEDGRQEVFQAKLQSDEEDMRLYKFEDGEVQDETYVQIEDEGVILVLDDEEYELDVIDSSIDGADIHLSCEDDDDQSVEIDAAFLLDKEGALDNAFSFSDFGDDDDDDDDEYDSFEEMFSDELEAIEDAENIIINDVEDLLLNALEYIEDKEVDLTNSYYGIYWDGVAHRCVRIDKVFVKKQKKSDKVCCLAVDELTDKRYEDFFANFELSTSSINIIVKDVVEEAEFGFSNRDL